VQVMQAMVLAKISPSVSLRRYPVKHGQMLLH
jgi:hypothetical protein